MDSIRQFRLDLFCSKSRVILLSVYIAVRLSLSCPSCRFSNCSRALRIANCSAWLLEQWAWSLNFSWCAKLPFTNIIPAAPNLSPILLPSVYTSAAYVIPFYFTNCWQFCRMSPGLPACLPDCLPASLSLCPLSQHLTLRHTTTVLHSVLCKPSHSFRPVKQKL